MVFLEGLGDIQHTSDTHPWRIIVVDKNNSCSLVVKWWFLLSIARLKDGNSRNRSDDAPSNLHLSIHEKFHVHAKAQHGGATSSISSIVQINGGWRSFGGILSCRWYVHCRTDYKRWSYILTVQSRKTTPTAYFCNISSSFWMASRRMSDCFSTSLLWSGKRKKIEWWRPSQSTCRYTFKWPF